MKWMADLEQLSNFSVQRCTKPADFGSLKTAELHHFSDASMEAYGTATYILLTNAQGEKNMFPCLMGKSRIAPLKKNHYPEDGIDGSSCSCED